MPLEIVELNHVNVTVPRSLEAEAKHFYAVMLGLSEIPKPGDAAGRGGAWYDLGPVQLHLSIDDGAKVEDARASRRHVCYSVKDVDAAERELRAAGLEILPDERPIEGLKRFYVCDPGGNRIEIIERAHAGAMA